MNAFTGFISALCIYCLFAWFILRFAPKPKFKPEEQKPPVPADKQSERKDITPEDHTDETHLYVDRSGVLCEAFTHPA